MSDSDIPAPNHYVSERHELHKHQQVTVALTFSFRAGEALAWRCLTIIDPTKDYWLEAESGFVDYYQIETGDEDPTVEEMITRARRYLTAIVK